MGKPGILPYATKNAVFDFCSKLFSCTIIVPGSSHSTSRFDCKYLQQARPIVFLRMFTIATFPPVCSGAAASSTFAPQRPTRAMGRC